jgi:hypothetical protein
VSTGLNGGARQWSGLEDILKRGQPKCYRWLWWEILKLEQSDAVKDLPTARRSGFSKEAVGLKDSGNFTRRKAETERSLYVEKRGAYRYIIV